MVDISIKTQQLYDASLDLLEACKSSCESIQKAFDIMDRGGKWSDAEVWLNNAKGYAQEAIEKATE